ncbi:MAG: gliding motility protein GldM [Paramuribaculum sp.]|nr:gliding motility protein GldM [Paramuribaculum sp.]
MAQSNNRMSPRQKMINLMYIVLTAMLALNVSSDVLDGFTQVEDGLSRTNSTVSSRNDAVFAQLEAFADANPDKAGAWYAKSIELRAESQRIYEFIDSLKNAIIIEADGQLRPISELENREDIEAAARVMLAPGANQGPELRNEIDAFRTYVQGIVTDSLKRASIDMALSTEVFSRPGVIVPQTWEEAKFDNQPAVAALTLLTKLQNDVRYAEGEALITLLDNIDAGDVRVNEFNAFVIPQSRMVMRGGRYTADIVLAAVDTTARPTIFINGNQQPSGHYELVASQAGTFNYSGYIDVAHGDGTTSRHPFSSEYLVIEPTATVSATMMNVLYTGIDNPISISVPGVPASSVSASMTGGSLVKSGDHWIARPAAGGSTATITVSAVMEGRSQTVSSATFKVRQLPDPTAYIPVGNERYRGNRPIAKRTLADVPGIRAAIDDGILDVEFQVLSFSIVILDSNGDAATLPSAGASFSPQQKSRIRSMTKGQRFYISRIVVKGPDGRERTLYPMEVIVN